jgi:hypothetical protein
VPSRAIIVAPAGPSLAGSSTPSVVHMSAPVVHAWFDEHTGAAAVVQSKLFTQPTQRPSKHAGVAPLH